MIPHVLGAALVIAFLVLITVLPFLPGSYDPLAAPLSLMARASGALGLFLVPIGAIWLVRPRHALAVAALVVMSLGWAAVSLVAVMTSGWTLGVATFLLGTYPLWTLRSRLRAATRTPALYLVVIPVTAFVLQLTLVGRAVEYSRNRAMQNATALIADIERYRATRGVYPQSLLAAWKDYEPDVIGIDRFHYEASGDVYNVVFEQIAADPATHEFVVYNPRDEQVFTSHTMALLRAAPEQLASRRGYFTVHAAPQPHWKFFWFD